MSFFKDRSYKKLLIALSILFFTSSSYADYARDDNGWKVEIAPYIWAIGMNGSVQTGPLRTHLDQTFSDILQQLNFAGMIWMDAAKGKFDIFVNLLYASLSDNHSQGPYKADLQNKFGLFSGGVSYEVYRAYFPSVNSFNSLAFDPYIGVRYTLNNTTLSLKGPGFDLSSSNNQGWVDPIIGLKLVYTLTKAWSVIVAGDIGGTNANTDTSYNVMGLLGYHPQTHWTNTTLYLGYRLLDQHYQHGSGLGFYDWNVKISGPLLGIAIGF